MLILCFLFPVTVEEVSLLSKANLPAYILDPCLLKYIAYLILPLLSCNEASSVSLPGSIHQYVNMLELFSVVKCCEQACLFVSFV